MQIDASATAAASANTEADESVSVHVANDAKLLVLPPTAPIRRHSSARRPSLATPSFVLAEGAQSDFLQEHDDTHDNDGSDHDTHDITWQETENLKESSSLSVQYKEGACQLVQATYTYPVVGCITTANISNHFRIHF